MASPSLVGRSPVHVVSNPGLYWGLWSGGLAIVPIMAIVTRSLWGVSFLDDTFDGGQTTLILLVAYIVLSLRGAAANEVAAAFCYGKALTDLGSGLHFIPFGIMQLRKGLRPVQEFQCPGEPEHVQKTGDEVPLEPGMVRPIRVVTGGPSDTSTDAILNTRMTLALSFFVQWAITDILNFASNYGSSAQVEQQVRDIGEAILAEIAVKHSPASFIDDLVEINKTLAKTVGDRFKNSGVRIISTRLVSPDLSHEVSIAIAGIPKARAEAEQVKFKAEGEKVKRTKEGEGAAAAALALLQAKAKGQEKMKNALGVDGDAVLASEAIGGILKETDVLIMGQGGMADAMGLVKAAQTVLNSGKGGQP